MASTKKNNSIRISGKVGYDVINDLINHQKTSASEYIGKRYEGEVSGGGTYIGDKFYVMENIANQAYVSDNAEAVRSMSTTDSVTGEINLSDAEKVDRKKYLEEVLMIDTKEADEWFKTRFRRDGALRNFGKLMSDRFKEALSWKRSFDPRIPPMNATGGRLRARLRFAGYYNKGAVWGDFNEYKEKKWYHSATDAVYQKEMLSLYTSGYKNEEPNYTNYHFNMGLGFGESQVFNPPFQYNDLDDPRTHPRYSKIGRVYVQRILNHMPIMMVMPGKIKYHTNALTMWGIDFGAATANADYLRSDNWFTKLISAAWMGITDVVGTTIAFATSIFTGGRLVTFRQQINLFEKYFNQTVTSLANNMGLISPTGLYAGRWKVLSLTHIQPGIGLQRSGFGGIFGRGWRGNQMIAFMMTKSVQCSESFSNSTRENPLQEQMNAESSEAQVQDQTGDKASSTIGQLFNFAQTGGDLSQLSGLGKYFGNKAGAFVSQMALIKSGAARLVLPDVWDSSSFSRSYNFTFDCFAPYGNPTCKLETWGIQLAFWLTMTLPRQVGSMSYIEPFIGRYVMPGKFNINFGIVESLSIDRGDDINDWNNTDNLPRSVKINVSIKDFQPSIILPQASRSALKMGYEALFPAAGFAEYMATVAGLSLADQMDWKKRFGRSFRQWTAGWRRRLNADILSKSIFNIGIVDRLGQIFAPYGDVFDKVEVLEDRASMLQYSDAGIKALKNGVQRSATGTDTGVFFLWPIRELYRTVYSGNGAGDAITKVLKAFGKIVKPSETEQGWDSEGLVKDINMNATDKELLSSYGNVDNINKRNPIS